MRIQLSNTNIKRHKILSLIILSLMFIFSSVMNKKHPEVYPNLLGVPINYIILIFGIFFYWYMFGRLYKVSFDDINLYYSNFFIEKQISLNEINRLTMGFIPIGLFGSHGYIITIKTKKGDVIKCLSKEIASLLKRETPEFIALKNRMNF